MFDWIAFWLIMTTINMILIAIYNVYCEITVVITRKKIKDGAGAVSEDFVKQNNKFNLWTFIVRKLSRGREKSLSSYIKLLSYYEKVRNNLCYVTNSFYNAQKNYEEDISTIK